MQCEGVRKNCILYKGKYTNIFKPFTHHLLQKLDVDYAHMRIFKYIFMNNEYKYGLLFVYVAHEKKAHLRGERC